MYFVVTTGELHSPPGRVYLWPPAGDGHPAEPAGVSLGGHHQVDWPGHLRVPFCGCRRLPRGPP